MEGYLIDYRPLVGKLMRACTMPSEISSRSIVDTTFSGSSCGGVSATLRPSKVAVINPSCVLAWRVVEDAEIHIPIIHELLLGSRDPRRPVSCEPCSLSSTPRNSRSRFRGGVFNGTMGWLRE